MCKIIAFTNVKQLDVKKTVNKIGNLLMKIERDGFGFACQGLNGVYGEKCIDEYFFSRLNVTNTNPSELVETNYSSFGSYSKPTGSLILHGRTSTNDLGLANTHPMIKEGNYLVHNGVVTDYGPEYTPETTNDSEHVLTRFIEGIGSVAKNLGGYYAFANVDEKGNLHIARDQTATLHMGWCEKYNTYIIATTRNLVVETATAIGAHVENIDPLKPDTYAVFQNNTMVSCESFKSRGYSYDESKWASKSLGYDLEDYDDYDDFSTYPNYKSVSENQFYRLAKTLTNSDRIYDSSGRNVISIDEFSSLTPKDQLECCFELLDGTWIECVA